MTYEIDKNGINLPNINDITDNLISQYQNVYGTNINVEQNTPDGQLINIKAQNQTDVNEIATYIYNSFDPNIAEGRALDRNVAYNGIKRNAGSYTQVPISMTANQTASLKGLNDNYTNPSGTGFTVADNLGNSYILITSTEVQAGTNILTFRAQNIGVIQPTLNTITNILTPQLGIVSCNNPSAPLQIGVEEESDYDLKNRFNQTFALGGLGNFDSLISSILNLNGVLSVSGENNWTNETSTQEHLPIVFG